MNNKNALCAFLDASPTAFHAVNNIKSALLAEGYTELYENDAWALADGGKYFVIRGGTALMAFAYQANAAGFLVASAHSDSPTFRVKGEETCAGAYTRLSVERYGGAVNNTWFDRPLSVAGRVMVKDGNALVSRLVAFDRDLCIIPTLAPHLNRNENFIPNIAVDMQPLCAIGTESGAFRSALAAELSVGEDAIVSHDLYLYNRDGARTVGLHGELIASGRIDDLGAVFSALHGFLGATPNGNVPVLAVFNNEEVGSMTCEGAASTFLLDTLRRIAGDRLPEMVASSFMVSADNGHALHPNHPEFSDKSNAPTLGGGLMIKNNSNRSYATDGFTEAVFRTVCERAGVKVQTYYNRADLRGGSTLGAISDTVVAIPTVDIGLPQLAMHSSYECAALSDVYGMTDALCAFFSSAYRKCGDRVTL